jgi:hypothetical protein
METQLREPIEAPTFWRKVSLQQGKKVIRVEQLVEDFAPSRTTVREEGKTSDIEPDLTLGSIRGKYLPPGAATCIVHLKADLDIVFPDMDAPGKLRIHDHRYQQEFEVNEHIVSLADMKIEGVLQTAEEAYLKNNTLFSDPYQREDPRIVPIAFKTGSEEALRSQLTDLLHAFPKIFEAVPEPRVFVHTEFDSHPASFNIHLYHRGQIWQAENPFLALVELIIRENTPSGYCYRNGTGALERRSEFHKDSLFLSIEAETPTQEQVRQARQNTTASFAKYGLTLNPEIFEHNPLRRDKRKPPGGRFALMTLLVGLGILGSLGLPVQNAVSPSARFATCATAFMLYAHERDLPPG